jgi:LysM repeat protein
MEAKKALEQIKSLLFAEQNVEASQEEVVIEFAEGVLADGTIVKFDKLEAGGMISVVTAEGEIPAPVGEHELEDGTIVVVSEPGIIAEVKMVEQDGNEVEVDVEMSSEEEESAKVEEEVVAEPQVDKFAEISETFNAKFAEVEAKIEFLNDISKRLVEFMEAYAKVESVEETQAPKNAFFAQSKNSKQDAYKRLQNVFQTLKK